MTALLYVLATFVLGLSVLRKQGEGVVRRMREQQMSGRMMGPELLMDDMAMGLAGVLLLIPGLVTDFAAVVVMIGPLRRRVVAWLKPGASASFHTSSHHAPGADRPHENVTIEGDYRRMDDR